MALPELDGALEPIVFAGRDSNTGKSHSLPVSPPAAQGEWMVLPTSSHTNELIWAAPPTRSETRVVSEK